MKCEFCVEEIADEARVCPHCRRDTKAGQAEKVDKRTRVFLWVVGTPIAILVLIVAAGSSGPHRTPGERMKESCAREFGAGSREAQECELRLTVQALEKDHQDRMGRAERAAGY